MSMISEGMPEEEVGHDRRNVARAKDRIRFWGALFFDFRLVELARDNAGKRTGSSNHEKTA